MPAWRREINATCGILIDGGRETTAGSRELFALESPLRGACRVLLGFRGVGGSCRGASDGREARKVLPRRLRQRMVGPEDLLEDLQRPARQRLRFVHPPKVPQDACEN